MSILSWKFTTFSRKRQDLSTPKETSKTSNKQKPKSLNNFYESLYKVSSDKVTFLEEDIVSHSQRQ